MVGSSPPAAISLPSLRKLAEYTSARNRLKVFLTSQLCPSKMDNREDEDRTKLCGSTGENEMLLILEPKSATMGSCKERMIKIVSD